MVTFHTIRNDLPFLLLSTIVNSLGYAINIGLGLAPPKMPTSYWKSASFRYRIILFLSASKGKVSKDPEI